MKIMTRAESREMSRPGYKRVTYQGRAYPKPEQAIAILREVLARDGIVVSDEDIWAVLELPGAICPYGATALIPES